MIKKIKTRKGNTKPKTLKQLEAHSRSLTKQHYIDNPMKNPEIAKKHIQDRIAKGTFRSPIFKQNILNNPSKLPHVREKFIKNNPMKNPEIVKKAVETRRLNRLKLNKLKGGQNENNINTV